MNKTITAAFNAAKTDPNTANLDALKGLAVPKFKEVYGRVQKAVRTINRHLGTNKGTPNRATLATAIGLADQIAEFKDVADVLNLPEMRIAADAALAIIGNVITMRKNRTYAHIDEMADFYTADETKTREVNDAKRYLANITNATIAAVNTINRHIADGTFNINTFKIAKVLGYADEVAILAADLATMKTNGLVTDDDVNAANAVAATITEIVNAKPLGYRVGIPALAAYDPFPNVAIAEEDGEEEE